MNRKWLLPVSVAVMAAAICFAVPEQSVQSVYEIPGRPAPENEIDRLILSNLTKLGIRPALCSDAVFVRRAYLDVLGKLPTAAEAAQFIDNPDTENKRTELIDQLLERNEYIDYWSMKWGDTLRIKAEFPINLWPNAAQAYHRWVHASLAANKPYDEFAREMLTTSGSNFRAGPVNFYRAIQNKTPEGIAIAVALTFMGVRADEWPKERLEDLTGFFTQVGYKPTAEWKEEFVFWDPLKSSSLKGSTAPGKAAITTINTDDKLLEPMGPTNTAPGTAVFPDGATVELSGDRDPREIFADWLISDDNPWFARSAANRIWAWLLGRGIVHESDDFREDNPPSNPELLDWLAKELVDSKYDLKHLCRLILNSQTYQFSSVAQVDHPEAAKHFATYPVRRLDAEVLIDAVNGITGTSDLYTSAIPEPFTYLPKDLPAVAIADGSITSPFLALFGRSARATGMASERNNQTLPAQWLHMLNSTHIQRKIETGPALRQVISTRNKPNRIIEDLYLTILSRYPTDNEIKTVMDYGGFNKAKPRNKPVITKGMTEKQKRQAKKKNQALARKNAKLRKAQWAAARSKWNDIAWALINSPEFLYRH